MKAQHSDSSDDSAQLRGQDTIVQTLEGFLGCFSYSLGFLFRAGRSFLGLLIQAGPNLPSLLAKIGHSRLALEGRFIARAIRQAWFPVLVSLCSLWLLGFPGLAFFQVQQTLVNTLSELDHFVGFLPVAGSVATVAMLAITLSAWSTRLIRNFYRAGERANAHLLILVMIIGMGPPLGFALCAMSVAVLPDVDPSLGRAAHILAAFMALAGLSGQALYYRLALHQHRRQSRNLLRWLPLALYLLLLLVFASDSSGRVVFARALGPVTLFAIALSFVVVVGSALISASRKTGIPLFAALVAWIFALNYYDLNDGHLLTKSFLTSRGELIDGAYTEWTKLRDVKDPNTAPVILVSAEGGGIRAGYMTGMVLAVIADRCPAAANRIFAISSVSGGSVGAAVYAAAVHANPLDINDRRCDFTDTRYDFFQKRIRSLLAADHLSTLFAKTVFTEPVQAVLPFPVVAFDRQRGLKESIRDDWVNLFNGGTIDRDVTEIVPSETSPSTPYLIMNATNMESGSRVTLGPLKISGSISSTTNLSSVNVLSVSLIESATTSARFQFVSPPGFLLNEEKQKLRYTDGGVFDNSGTVTASKKYKSLIELRDGSLATFFVPDPWFPKEMPILVINITNGASCWSKVVPYSLGPCAPPEDKPTLHAVADTVNSLFAVRDTHTGLFKDTFYEQIVSENHKRDIKGYAVRKLPDGKVGHIENDTERKLEGRADKIITWTLHSDISVPLGWLLSKRTADQMDRQIFEEADGMCRADWSPLGYRFDAKGDVTPTLSNGCAFAVLADYFDSKGFHLLQVPQIGRDNGATARLPLRIGE